MENKKYIKTSDTYNEGILLDIYKIEYSLAMASEDKNGEIYLRWVFPQTKDREPGKKAIPLKITLGLKDQAIQRLEQLLMMIE